METLRKVYTNSLYTKKESRPMSGAWELKIRNEKLTG
jgi:hypothetical protein